MDNKKNVINPSTSGIQISLDLPLLSDHVNLVKKPKIEKGYDTDYPCTSKHSTSRLPLQSPF